MSTALYICYFGLDEALVQTQVLPYLRAIAQSGVRMHLLTFEKTSAWNTIDERRRRRELRKTLGGEGVRWHTLRYHKRPALLATAYDIALGFLYSSWLSIRHGVGIIHARAHVPGVMGLALKRIFGVRLIFDLRGLMAEEYVDNGVWRENSLPFRMVKRAERTLVMAADHVVVLTNRLADTLTRGEHPLVEAGKLSVIPCCVDLSRYPVPERKPQPGMSDAMTLVYVGSATGRYFLREMADFFRAFRDKAAGARLLVVTQSDRVEARHLLEAQGLDASSYTVVRAAPHEVAVRLAEGDVGISFIKPSAALAGASPTKIGEYLAAGLPVVSSHGVGDTDLLLASNDVGFVVTAFDRATYETATDRILTLLLDVATPMRCRETAERYYSLRDVGEPRYQEIYRRLSFTDGAANATGERLTEDSSG
jgi:glycosyltransferase involved in cell wall biosynthesis